MKRIIATLFCVSVFVIMLSACNDNIKNEQSDDTAVAIEQTEDRTYPLNNNYLTEDFVDNNLYDDFGAGKDKEFQLFIQENPIDIAFSKEIENTVSSDNNGMSASTVYSKYAEIWREELDESVDVLCDLLNDESDKEALLSAHNHFLLALDEEISVACSILTPITGTSITVIDCQKYIKEYRDRTFEIKYLSYQIERFSDEKFNDNYLSLRLYH